MERQAFDTYRPVLFPRLQRVADALGHLSFLGTTTLASHGDHLPSEPEAED